MILGEWRRVFNEGIWVLPTAQICMAEREGFEPSMSVNPYTLSRGAPSAARPPLHTKTIYNKKTPLINLRTTQSQIPGCFESKPAAD